jgi:hypothetical protein
MAANKHAAKPVTGRIPIGFDFIPLCFLVHSKQHIVAIPAGPAKGNSSRAC